MSEEKNRN